MLPPMLMYLRTGTEGTLRRGVWLPLFLVWILFLPLVLLVLALTLLVDFFLLIFGQRYHHLTLLMLSVFGLLGDLRGMTVHVHDNTYDIDIEFV